MTKFIIQDETMKNAAKQAGLRLGGSMSMLLDGEVDKTWELRSGNLVVDVTQHADGTASVLCFFFDEQEPLAETKHMFKNVSNVVAAIRQIVARAKGQPIHAHLQIEKGWNQ